jgi:hypothetical protein
MSNPDLWATHAARDRRGDLWAAFVASGSGSFVGFVRTYRSAR